MDLASPATEQWTLHGDDGHGNPLQLNIPTALLEQGWPGLTLGRHPALCELSIDETSVSQRHFRLTLEHGQLYIEDLNSLNGTLLDNTDLAPFRPLAVEVGQTIRAGRVSLELRALT